MKTIIHIGQHKTGTTSIQHYLRDNRVDLAKKGLYVPASLFGYDNPSHFILNVYALGENRFSSMKEKLLATKNPEYFQRLKQNLENDIARHYQRAIIQKCKDIIWSNEGLYLLNSVEEYKRLYDLFDKHSSKIICICCFRDIESYRTSYMKQLKKQGFDFSGNKDSYRYLEPDSWLFDFNKKKEILSNVFEKTIFFSYTPEDIVKIFMEKIGYSATKTGSFRLNVTHDKECLKYAPVNTSVQRPRPDKKQHRKKQQNDDEKSGCYNKMVNFIICGTQKGGTTAVDAYLREHPQICMADKKEVHFFDNETYFHKKPDYSKYCSFFNPQPVHKLIGEATPIYMYWINAPRRIWEYNSDMKLIVLLRNPIERAYSHWNMEHDRKKDDLSFWKAIKTERERCREALPLQHRVYSYIDRGFYLEQLRRLWLFFPREQILILKNEYLKNQPNKALQEIYDFLQIDSIKNIKALNVHSLPYESKMTHKERKYLEYIFEYEIREIERVLNWDCSDWLTG